MRWLNDLVNIRVDYRLILLGSLLPDIIDKPLGIWLLRDTLSNGRVFGHTLLLMVVMAAAGIYLYVSRRRAGLLWLAFGSLAHLGLDQMWLNPRTLLWPLYGWIFERHDVSHWVERLYTPLVAEPSMHIPEIIVEAIGAFLLGSFFITLIRRGRLLSFLRTGEAD